MNNLKFGNLDKLIVHFIGNKSKDEGVKFSNILTPSEYIESYIMNLATDSFKQKELYNFYFVPNIELNPMFQFAKSSFEDVNIFIEQSQNIARYLYDKSIHPQIKNGELCISYFKNCEFNGEYVDCLALFKSENKETILKVDSQTEGIRLKEEKGININKLDKGCLIFNIDRDNGYVVAVVDNTNKGSEAHYWIDDFLHVRQRQDEYYDTQNLLKLTQSFVKELSNEFDGATKADLIHKTVKFFKEKDSFDMDEFANEVIEQPDVIDSFNNFRDNYEKERDIEIADNFNISDTAVKKQARSLKSIIKLDKNFHIYIHGDRNMIENGEDDKGKFYKVYYKDEQ